jgi:hypothetical protein
MKLLLADRSSTTQAFNKKRNILEVYMNGHLNSVGWSFMVCPPLLAQSIPAQVLWFWECPVVVDCQQPDQNDGACG